MLIEMSRVFEKREPHLPGMPDTRGGGNGRLVGLGSPLEWGGPCASLRRPLSLEKGPCLPRSPALSSNYTYVCLCVTVFWISNRNQSPTPSTMQLPCNCHEARFPPTSSSRSLALLQFESLRRKPRPLGPWPCHLPPRFPTQNISLRCT